jgi:GDP-L-fucose synthase
MKKVLILGGTGFLGKQVSKQLSETTHKVVSVSRKEGIDLTNLSDFADKLTDFKPDVIINCAAHVGSVHYAIQYAGDMIYDNMQIELNLYKAVQSSSPKAKIINPISNCTYPGDANIHNEPDWEKGPVHDSVLPYASSRRMVYALAESFRKQYKIKSVNWLIANAYGPGDYSDPNKVHALNGIIIRLLKSKKEGNKTFEIWGSGTPTREWVYIEDVAKMLCYSVDNIEEQVYPLNLAQNKAYSILEIAKIAAKALDYNVDFVFNTKYADGAPFKILDNKLFRGKYPSFSFTPLNEGIKDTIDYYKGIFA